MCNLSLHEANNARENRHDYVASGSADNHTQYFKLWMTSLIFFIYLSFSLFPISQAVAASRILVLNSYHKGLLWTDNIVSGIESVLVRENIGADLVIEYMDSKAVKYDKTYKTMLYKLYSHKYGYQRFDIIISSDDNAFDFLREYRKEIFPDTPIVFCGVNNLEAPTIISKDHFTGILEIAAQKETLDLALKIHPETKQVVIITDTTSSGQYSWRQLEPLFIRYPDITFTRIDDRFSISEIEDRMKKLADDTIAIFTSLYRDKTGRYISLSEGTSRISKSSKRPIYSFHIQVLQHGTIGGKLLGGQHHGEKTAELAIRVLQGEKVSNIPIVDQSDAQYIFDYQQLERFGIKSSDLPGESIIVNKPASIYEQNKQEIWIVFGVLVFLITVVVLLALYIMRNRRAEQDRLENEEKLRLLFDYSPIGICTVDLLGNFVTTNPAYEQMLGYSKEELRELSFFEVTHPDYRPKNKALFQNMFSLNSTGFKIEKKYINNDGDEIDVSVNATAVIDDKGHTRFGTAFVEDITKEKQVEEELEKYQNHLEHIIEERNMELKTAQRMVVQKEKLAAIGKLSGSVAHDIRNPLGIISNSIYFLTQIEMSSLDKRLEKHLNIMESAIGRASDIITDLLDFSRENRPDLREWSINKEILSLGEVFKLPENISLGYELDSSIQPFFFDQSQIKRILHNLFTNALQAMPNGGLLKISSKLVDGSVELKIRDNGTGIEPEHINNIYEPLFTTKSKGVGLGLSIAKTFVEMHNGAIEVESITGKCTTFTVTLPLNLELNDL